MNTKLKCLALASLLTLNACASRAPVTAPDTPVAAGSTSKSGLNVVYTTRFMDNSTLKQIPEEIMIVRSETTQGVVAAQVGLNVLLMALGGGMSMQTFSKDGLKGSKIEDVKDRDNLKNPIPTTFVSQLQGEINVVMEADPRYSKRYKNPLNVAGGSTRLIYESITGEEAQQFRMQTDLTVYKRKEGAGLFSTSPFVSVGCSRVSEKARPIEEWSKDDYLAARDWLNETVDQCSEKVLNALPELLAVR